MGDVNERKEMASPGKKAGRCANSVKERDCKRTGQGQHRSIPCWLCAMVAAAKESIFMKRCCLPLPGRWGAPSRWAVGVGLVFCAVYALAQPATNVVPNGLGNVEGNSSTSDPFTSSSFRLQQVFDASEFGFAGGNTYRIDSIWFRIDASSAGNAEFSFTGSAIQLSTTAACADSLSPVFADNIGPNVTTIYHRGTT
jgi:hypothetical protein